MTATAEIKESKLIKHALVSNKHWPQDNSPTWCFMITNQQEMDVLEECLLKQRALKMLHGVGAWKESGLGLDAFSRFEAGRNNRWRELIEKGVPILVWQTNGGYATPNSDLTIHEVIYLEFPKMPNEAQTADILVCENDSQPELWWNDVLANKYPKKSISVLTLFSERSVEELAIKFKSASVISFTTTFTSMTWFETILDVLYWNDMTGKTIFGNHANSDWVQILPSRILEKLEAVKAMGNKVEFYQD